MRRTALLLLGAALLLSGCSSTSIVSSWKAPDATQSNLKNILVVGLMGNRERQLRENVEGAIAQQLQQHGLNATTGTAEFGPNGFRGLTEEQVTAKVAQEGFNAVLIVSLMDKQKERDYVPGNSYTTPRVVGYSRYYRRYMVVYDRVYNPGYYTNSTNYVLQAEIYSIPGNELLYSAQTKSYDPNSPAKLAEEFAKSIAENLKQQGLLYK